MSPLTERRVVDNRVFLLGLDGLYRTAMKPHERGELLECARRTAEALKVAPADVPIEGYYGEDAGLTEYFRLMRALQQVEESAAPRVSGLPEFQRLKEVTSAPLFGRPAESTMLLPAARDALAEALDATFPGWTVSRLTELAYEMALKKDDFSLVGLAAWVKDPVVLAALRESVVLYADVIGTGMPPTPEYVWAVDPALARQAGRFIDTFKALFGDALPAPEPENAKHYWFACEDNEILGRCVRLGWDGSGWRRRHYHWAICRSPDGAYRVQEFWNSDVWTTTRYRASLRSLGGCPKL